MKNLKMIFILFVILLFACGINYEDNQLEFHNKVSSRLSEGYDCWCEVYDWAISNDFNVLFREDGLAISDDLLFKISRYGVVGELKAIEGFYDGYLADEFVVFNFMDLTFDNAVIYVDEALHSQENIEEWLEKNVDKLEASFDVVEINFHRPYESQFMNEVLDFWTLGFNTGICIDRRLLIIDLYFVVNDDLNNVSVSILDDRMNPKEESINRAYEWVGAHSQDNPLVIPEGQTSADVFESLSKEWGTNLFISFAFCGQGLPDNTFGGSIILLFDAEIEWIEVPTMIPTGEVIYERVPQVLSYSDSYFIGEILLFVKYL